MKKFLIATLAVAASVAGVAAVSAANRSAPVKPATPTPAEVRALDARTNGAEIAELRSGYTAGLERARTCAEDEAAKVLDRYSIDVAVSAREVEWSADGYLGAFGLESSDLDLSAISKEAGEAALSSVSEAQAACVQKQVAAVEADYQLRYRSRASLMGQSASGFGRCVADAAGRLDERDPGASELRAFARAIEDRPSGQDLRVALTEASLQVQGSDLSPEGGQAVSSAVVDCGQAWPASFYDSGERGAN
jgi:hypothetical protein